MSRNAFRTEFFAKTLALERMWVKQSGSMPNTDHQHGKWGATPVPLSNCNKIGNQSNTEQEKWGSVALLVECVCVGDKNSSRKNN